MVLHWKDDPHMDDQNTKFLFIYFNFFLLLSSNLYFTFVCLDWTFFYLLFFVVGKFMRTYRKRKNNNLVELSFNKLSTDVFVASFARCRSQAFMMDHNFIKLSMVRVLKTLSHLFPPTGWQTGPEVCLRIIFSKVSQWIKRGPTMLLRSKLWYVSFDTIWKLFLLFTVWQVVIQ